MVDYGRFTDGHHEGLSLLLLRQVINEDELVLCNRYKVLDNKNANIMDEKARWFELGKCFTLLVEMWKRGATLHEACLVCAHIVVLLNMVEYTLNAARSYADCHISEMMEKYHKPKPIYGIGSEPEESTNISKERHNKSEENDKAREALKRAVAELRDIGLKICEIAEKLNKPESTIRNLLKDE